MIISCSNCLMCYEISSATIGCVWGPVVGSLTGPLTPASAMWLALTPLPTPILLSDMHRSAVSPG